MNVYFWVIIGQNAQIHRSAAGSDMKLRVSLENLLAAEQVGRWWIVGSSWSGAPMISEQGNTSTKQSTTEGQVESRYHSNVHYSCIVGTPVQDYWGSRKLGKV